MFPAKGIKAIRPNEEETTGAICAITVALKKTHAMHPMQSNGRARFILKLREKAADLERLAVILQGT